MSLEKKRPLKIEFFTDFIKKAGIKTVLDIRSFKANASSKSLYHPLQLKAQFHENGIQYISIGQKIGKFYENYNSASQKAKKYDLTDRDFCKVIIDFVDSLNDSDYPIGLLFRYWEAEKTWKAIFSKRILDNYDGVQLYHLAPGATNKSWNVYSNSNLYNDGYGNLLNIYNDMIAKSSSNFDDSDSEGELYSSQDWEDMYRSAFDGNPDAEWNID